MRRWASGWELQLLEITGNCCRRRNIWQGAEQHRLLQKGDHNGKVPSTMHKWSTSGVAGLNCNFIIKILHVSILQDINQREVSLDSRSAQIWFSMDTVFTISVTQKHSCFPGRKKLVWTKLYPSVNTATSMEWQETRWVFARKKKLKQKNWTIAMEENLL